MHLAVIGQVVDVDRKYSLPAAPELSRGQAHEGRNRGAGLPDVLCRDEDQAYTAIDGHAH